jgi:N6-L-threonylcarbamoyladenine synthase
VASSVALAPARAVILGLETSCDETAAALISRDGRILANVVSSQADLHAQYGGVVPEVASRRHLELVTPVIREALRDAEAELDDVELVGVTAGPGLIGALLVGVAAAKAIAWARRLPLAPVDHLHGHVASLYLEPTFLEPPFLCLLASGGHTLLLDVHDRGHAPRVLGTTIDDAAGEAFDKGARLLGLGYPGGAAVDRLARDGDPEAYDFPVARVPGLDFSFSGVKTALLYAVRELEVEELEARRADLAASYQRAIVRALVERTQQAAQTRAVKVAVVGGVAANSELRASLPDAVLAPLSLCTDNAAMISSAARFVEPIAYPGYLGLDAYASSA